MHASCIDHKNTKTAKISKKNAKAAKTTKIAKVAKNANTANTAKPRNVDKIPPPKKNKKPKNAKNPDLQKFCGGPKKHKDFFLGNSHQKTKEGRKYQFQWEIQIRSLARILERNEPPGPTWRLLPVPPLLIA